MTADDRTDPHAPFENEDELDGIDLTPRVAPAVGGRSKGQRKTAILVALGLLALAVVYVAYQGLSNASVFFRNADEAVAQRDELGTSRFRLQGSVVAGTVEADADGVRFDVEFDGVEVEVVHQGDPPELFQDGIPVVLEGHWVEGESWFASDRILVKHTETYVEDNPDRVDDYVGNGSND